MEKKVKKKIGKKYCDYLLVTQHDIFVLHQTIYVLLKMVHLELQINLNHS